MVTRVCADEVTEFRTAVAGVEIDWVRTDLGWGPATMVSSGTADVMVSTGGLDFSAVLNTVVPDDRLAVQLATNAPPGMRWCGSEARPSDVRIYGPGAEVLGLVPAGSRAVTLVASRERLEQVGAELGFGDLSYPSTSHAAPATAEVTKDFVAATLISGPA